MRALCALLVAANLYAQATAPSLFGVYASKITTVASSPYITAASLSGGLRNNYTGNVGFKFTVGSSPIVVTSLGRMFFTGNTGTHTVKIALASNEVDVTGASVSISMTGGVNNTFKYVALSTPVTLSASTAYVIVSGEVASGDQFADTATVTATSDATVNGSIYTDGSNHFQVADLSSSAYVPTGFLYHL